MRVTEVLKRFEIFILMFSFKDLFLVKVKFIPKRFQKPVRMLWIWILQTLHLLLWILQRMFWWNSLLLVSLLLLIVGCGHCKSLVPIYETLATYYQTEKENCVIAKVDATSNEQLAGQYGVRGYPTILLFGKGEEKKPISYDKNRDLESFVYFLNQHCGTLVTPQGYLDDHAGVLMSFGLCLLACGYLFYWNNA
jgi:protein disulfide-isomerase-like protein